MTYQKSHTQYPLEKSVISKSGGETFLLSETIHNRDEYQYIKFSEDTIVSTDISPLKKTRVQTIQGSLYKHVGYNEGLSTTYDFKFIEGCWYLIKIEQKSI